MTPPCQDRTQFLTEQCIPAQNFLLTNKGPEGELKLTDFGLGVFFRPGERFRDLVSTGAHPQAHMHRKAVFVHNAA